MRDERAPGSQVSVDDSALVPEQGGKCPSPPGSLSEGLEEGVGVRRPCLPGQSRRGGKPPVILTDTANLDASFLKVPFYRPSRCTPKYVVLGCGCQHGESPRTSRGRRIIVPSVCMSLDCETCRPFVGERRKISIYRRLLGATFYQRRRYHRQPVLYTVLTVPPAVRERYLDPKVWQKVRMQAWRMLRDNFGALYAVEGSHPRGDWSPTEFHPHLNFLWVQKKGWSPFLDVNTLRDTWSALLGVETVDVYHRYSHAVGQIIFWSEYVSRTFPGTHKWTGPIRWYGKYPKVKRPQDVVCWDCGCKFKVIGWIDAAEVQQWENTGILMGRDPPWYDDSKIVHIRRRKRKKASAA